MKAVHDIYCEFRNNSGWFHKRIENDMFEEAILAYFEKKYTSSAVICCTLYEGVFITRLSREHVDKDFIPSKENIKEQIQILDNSEKLIMEKDKLSFKNVLTKLEEHQILSPEENRNYYKIYTDYRNPALHWLLWRLYKNLYWKDFPWNSFQFDAQYELIYKDCSEKLINEIYELMTIKKLRKS